MPTARLLQFIAFFFITSAASLFASSADDAVAAVLAADKARGAALLAADVKALDRLLADDLRYTHSNGMLETKAIHIGTFTAGLRYERFETSKLHGQVIAPGVVVLTGVINQRKGTAGKWTDFNNLLFHAVWRLDAGSWRLASLQTAVPPAPAAPPAK